MRVGLWHHLCGFACGEGLAITLEPLTPASNPAVLRRQILKKIVDTKTAMGETLRASAFSLTEAKYAAGEFRHTVFDNVGLASVRVKPWVAETGGPFEPLIFTPD